MADIADVAQAHMEAEQAMRDKRRAAAVELVSAAECEECGDDIPRARQEAVKGCRHCVECQRMLEVLHARLGGVL